MALPSENGGSVGLSTVLEADVKQIVNMVRETFEKYSPPPLSSASLNSYCI